MASLLCLVLGAASYALITRFALPPLAWAGLPMLLHATRTTRLLPGAALSWVALYLALAITRRSVIPVGGAAFFAIVAMEAALPALAFALDRVVSPRLGGVAATLVFPLALTALEFLRARLTPAASWGSIAYSQYGALPLMQVVSVTGIWGVTFLLAWFASVAELAWSAGPGAELVRGPIVACGIVIGIVLSAGSLRVALAAADNPVVRVATLNRPRDLFVPGDMTRISEGRIAPADRDHVQDQLSRLHQWFLDGSRREAHAGARIVAWPEQNLLVLSEDEPAFLERAAQLAAAERVYLVIGMGTIHVGDRLPFENKVVVVDPSGRQIASHLKSRPVAGWEASIMKRGSGSLPIVNTPAGRVAAAICYEADFPELMRQAGHGSADALVVVANDWKAIGDLHLQMHAFRAIENGASLVRAAASGVSAAIDPWGRTLASADYFARDGGTMVAEVPFGHVPTLYARWGDWFAWMSIAALVAIVLYAASMRSAQASASHSASTVPTVGMPMNAAGIVDAIGITSSSGRPVNLTALPIARSSVSEDPAR